MDEDLTTEMSRIDELLVALEESGTVLGLMREHLVAARTCLFESMPGEYALCMELAEKLLPEIQNEDLHASIADFLHRHRPQRKATRGGLHVQR
jgi:hypothetical protein